jgi:hypothetical protein
MARLIPELGTGQKNNFINFMLLSLYYIYVHFILTLPNQCRTAALTATLQILKSLITEVFMSRQNKCLIK